MGCLSRGIEGTCSKITFFSHLALAVLEKSLKNHFFSDYFQNLMGRLPLTLFPLTTKSHRFRIKLLLDHLLRHIFYRLIKKINNPFFRHPKVMGYPLRTRSQNTTTTTSTTTTTTCQQSKLLTAMTFPKETLSQRRKLLQPQQVKHHDHNVYIIITVR